MFLEYTNNYPWLWAVYVLILAVIVGIVGTCCLRLRRVSSYEIVNISLTPLSQYFLVINDDCFFHQNKDDFEREILHKKTDEFQPDDAFAGRGDVDQQVKDEEPVEELENAEPKLATDEYEEDTDPVNLYFCTQRRV